MTTKRQQLTSVEKQSLMVVVMEKVKEKNPNVVAKLAGDLLAGSSAPVTSCRCLCLARQRKKKIKRLRPTLREVPTNPAILLPY